MRYGVLCTAGLAVRVASGWRGRAGLARPFPLVGATAPLLTNLARLGALWHRHAVILQLADTMLLPAIPSRQEGTE